MDGDRSTVNRPVNRLEAAARWRIRANERVRHEPRNDKNLLKPAEKIDRAESILVGAAAGAGAEAAGEAGSLAVANIALLPDTIAADAVPVASLSRVVALLTQSLEKGDQDGAPGPGTEMTAMVSGYDVLGMLPTEICC